MGGRGAAPHDCLLRPHPASYSSQTPQERRSIKLSATVKEAVAEWMMREEEDEERVDMVQAFWEFNYDEMGKAERRYPRAADPDVTIESGSERDRRREDREVYCGEPDC